MSTELFPISCVSCRRRKIKCNKKKPCDQCIKRQLICEFPATFRNVKIPEDEIESQPQDEANLIVDRPIKIVEESTTTPTSGTGSVLSSGRNISSSETTESRPISSGNNSISGSQSPEKVHTTLNKGIESRSNSSSSIATPLRLFTFDNQRPQQQLQQPIRSKYDSINYLELQEKYQMMRAANSQLLSDNRNLNNRVKDLLHNSNLLLSEDIVSNRPHIFVNNTKIGSKRSADALLDGFPNKKDRVGYFGQAKESFSNDTPSDNLGMYSTNKPSQVEVNNEANDETTKEISADSTGSVISGEELGEQDLPEPQLLSGDGRLATNSRKQSEGNRNKYHHQQQVQQLPHQQSVNSRIINGWERDIANLHDEELFKSNLLVENSFKKKKLPILPSYLLKYDDPNLSTDSDTYADVCKLNIKVIIKLVQGFFENSPYYRTFIPCASILEFLNKYESMTDKDWNNDDDLLLVYMILCLSIQRLSPKDYVDLSLLSDASVNTCTKYRKYLTRHVIYKRFEALRENLVHESLQTIRAYILCVEWLFMDQKYEDCWSMMFHACSVSYSIGLHIVGQYSFQKSKVSNNIYALDSATEDSDNSDKKFPELSDGDLINDTDKNIDVSRFRLWCALKYYTSIVCAIFGRPNPISVQVSMNKNDNSTIIPNKLLHILLKIGLSESLRSSNLMLIENYMINITFDDLMKLAENFNKEIQLLEKTYKWFDESSDDTASDLSSTSSEADHSNSNSNNTANSLLNRLGYDDFTKNPLAPTQLDVLSDTIILYINRAKLFEPFIKKFENHKDYHSIVATQIDSLTKFLDLSTLFVDKFIKNNLERHFRSNNSSHENTLSDEERSKNDHPQFPRPHNNTNFGPVKIGRWFKTYYPFLGSLVCQGIIVVFTLLHSKSKEFVKNDQSTLLNNSFLKIVENNLNKFLSFESTMSNKFITTTRMWSSNMVYIINRVLNLIKLIYEKQGQKVIVSEKETRSPKDTSKVIQINQDDFPITTSRGHLSYLLNPNPFGDPSQFEYLNGFHLNDPFWLSVPDNLPYYLGSQIEMDQFKNQRKPSDSYHQE